MFMMPASVFRGRLTSMSSASSLSDGFSSNLFSILSILLDSISIFRRILFRFFSTTFWNATIKNIYKKRNQMKSINQKKSKSSKLTHEVKVISFIWCLGKFGDKVENFGHGLIVFLTVKTHSISANGPFMWESQRLSLQQY